jgi:DNA-3-methyladenine glycosylase
MSQSSNKLPRAFYSGDDVVGISRKLLGKILCSRTDGQVLKARIVETEAYCGRNDRACHAFDGRRTERTEVMYGRPGHAYVYLCYGIHHLFNVVTNREGVADAVLVRAVEPVEGIVEMAGNRGYAPDDPRLTNGPGKLSQALSITSELTRVDLLGNRLWLEKPDMSAPDATIVATTRVGIGYAEEDANLPWRFYLKGSPWVSRP